MALRGNLKELSLPDIFQLITFSGKTGVLRIHRADGAEGSVWFRDGDVFFAQSNWRAEPLGERLVDAQRITPMALERALELRVAEGAEGRRLGDILVDEGYITDKVLEEFVQEQMQDTIFDLMRWDEGDFEFEAMPEAPEEDIGLAVSIENIIMEGSRRLDEWNRIKKKIPSTDVVFKMATAPGEGTFEISLKPIEWNLLLLVDGTRSVAELAVETGRTDFEVARIIYGLFSAGLLEFASDDEVAAARAEREDRETRLAQIETARAAEEAAVAQAAEAAAAAQAAEEAAAAQAAEAARTVEPTVHHVEEPQFLGADRAPAGPEDQATLDAVMGALLTGAPAPAAAPAPTPTPAPEEQAPAKPAAEHYVPAEEPAFMAAGPSEPAVSVEELLADIVELAPAEPAQLPIAAPEAPEAPEAPAAAVPFAAETAQQPEFAGEPTAQSDIFIPVPAPEIEPAAEPVNEIAFEFLPVVESAPADEPVVFEFESLTSVTESLEVEVPVAQEPETAAIEAPEIEEPGTFVVVPMPESYVPALEPSQSPIPAEEPPVSSMINVPEVVPSAPAASPSNQPPGLQGFEHDLMALGLGELPSELLGRAEEATPVPQEPVAAEQDVEIEAVREPMGVSSWQTEPIADEEPAAAIADFSDLLSSLDIAADDQAARPGVAEAQSEVALPAIEEVRVDEIFGEAEQPSAGVISTDSYLDGLDSGGDFHFQGELTDELSALTGAERRARPAASVRQIPAEGEALLTRDSRVDKDTLIKIIEGIKNL